MSNDSIALVTQFFEAFRVEYISVRYKYWFFTNESNFYREEYEKVSSDFANFISKKRKKESDMNEIMITIDRCKFNMWLELDKKCLDFVCLLIKKKGFLNLGTYKTEIDRIKKSLIDIREINELKKIYDFLHSIKIELTEEEKFFRIQIIVSAVISFLGALFGAFIGFVLTKLFH